MDLLDRINAGGTVIMDGATGTELERRGVPMDGAAWCAAALATHPEVVREVHEDYIRAGAEIVITNTFPAARHVLESAGLGEQVRELNGLAVRLAVEARESVAEGEVYVAGSVSTFPPFLDHSRTLSGKEAQDNYFEQAEVLAESGVDLIMLEMMRDIEQTGYAVEAAVATGLPVWAGFSFKMREDETVVLWDGETTIDAAFDHLPLDGVSLVAVMHTLVEDTPAALREVVKHWDGLVGAYPHAGRFVMPNWQFIDEITPENFAEAATEWHALGARMLGGCCGIGPEHVRALSNHFQATNDAIE